MYNANSGYVGHSMSLRAKQAYNDGLLSFSKIRATHLKENGIEISLKFFKWLVNKNYITPTEWHHTGKLYNKTNFFDLEDVKEQVQGLDLQTLETEFINVVNCNAKGYYAKVEFKEWSGSRRYGKYVSETTFAYIYKGWAYINSTRKKNIDGNNFDIQETYNRKPREMNTKTKDEIFKILKLK
ncbi:hypothetical protein SMD22_02070 (plasmid) [Brevibacillus halotolerans]|nr:hypothetical protein SMD22_02070 [Brevibacillus halotolerans]